MVVKLKENEVLIRIGHPAYTGDNSVRMCFSKAQAVRVLCNRGICRDKARNAIKEVMQAAHAYITVSTLVSVIEITNCKWNYNNGNYFFSYKDMKNNWKETSEL